MMKMSVEAFKMKEKKLQEKAQKGDADAYRELGDLYYTGLSGNERNSQKAYPYWRQAAERGNSVAAGRIDGSLITDLSENKKKNKPISYVWPYSWMGMASKTPRMDPMIQAIINEDVDELRRLRAQGFSLRNSDEGTLKRTLFEKISSTRVMKLLIEEEYISSFISADSTYHHAKYITKCINERGYSWGLIAKACYERAYEVMDLLARFRFDDTLYCFNGTDGPSGGIEDIIFQRDDVTAIKILYENGIEHYTNNHYDECVFWWQWRDRYPNSSVTKYLSDHPYPVRRSMGLDNFAFRKIEQDKMEKVGLFNRKAALRRNEYRRLDYEDRVKAQNDYIRWLDRTGRWSRWMSYVKADRKSDAVFFDTLYQMYH